MAIQAHNRTIPDWLTRIRTRQIALPRFQRYEAWTHSNVTQLLNTVLQELPIGAVLVLQIGDDEPFVRRELPGAPDHGERVTEHLLDGQQRLVALWRALNNNYSDRTYFLYLKPDNEVGMPFYVESVARWRREGDTMPRPFWANDAVKQWERRAIPLDLVAPGDAAQDRYKEWAKTAIGDAEERESITEYVTKVREKFLTFNVPYLALPVGTQPETALDVFMKMNTSAAPLTMYDIVVAQVEAGLGRSLHDLVAETRYVCPAIAEYYPTEELTLAAGALLQERAPTKATYMSSEFSTDLIKNWERYERGLRRAVEFLEEERVFDAVRLPTEVVVPVLAALWGDVPDGLDAEGRARTIMRRYLWRAFFTRRYESATNTRALTDYIGLRRLIQDSSAEMPAIFDDEQHPLPEANELLNAGWPKKKDRLGRAILALSLREGGRDLADGSTINRTNIARREYHHIFPVAHLAYLGDGKEAYLALNCALVTWRTNRNIADKEPEQYLGERRVEGDPKDSEVQERLASHLIPHDAMVAGDYEAFLHKRAAWVHDVMIRMCQG